MTVARGAKSDRPGRQFFPVLICFLSTFGAIVQVWLLWFSDLPLGVDKEWTWSRAATSLPAMLECLPAVAVGILLIVYVSWTAGQNAKRPQTVRWLCGLLLLGFAWTTAVIAASPAGGGIGRSVFVVFYPRTSGYYHQALFEAEDLRVFLREYETKISDSSKPDNYLHIGTHPPGLTLSYRLLIDACKQSPLLLSIAERTQPESVAAAIDLIGDQQLKSGMELTRPAAAALWLSVLFCQCIAVIAVVPMYLLAKRLVSISTARIVAASWLLVPAMILFLPKSDAAFPCLALFLQWTWLKALERNSFLYGILTAFLFTCAATLSLAFFTVGVILFLQMINTQFRYQRGWKPTVSGLLTGVMYLILIRYFLDVNLFTIWLQNFENHGMFYDHNSRTYLSWLLVNPLEAGIALGLPLAVFALAGCLTLLRRENREHAWVLLGLLIWSVLWISGKNMGEAARLWLFIMPYALFAGSLFLEKLSQSNNRSLRSYIPTAMITIQAIVCFLTAIQIDGFGFTEL